MIKLMKFLILALTVTTCWQMVESQDLMIWDNQPAKEWDRA
jgi:hypothetical protein